jgi:hypothetical protein
MDNKKVILIFRKIFLEFTANSLHLNAYRIDSNKRLASRFRLLILRLVINEQMRGGTATNIIIVTRQTKRERIVITAWHFFDRQSTKRLPMRAKYSEPSALGWGAKFFKLRFLRKIELLDYTLKR